MLYVFDLVGVAVFAVSGALVAARKGMDLFGGMVLAVVTAIGGGTIRDLLLDEPVFWIGDPTYVIVAGGVALVTEIFGPRILPRGKPLLFADACGLALFTVMGAAKANATGTPAITAVVMGVLTGVAGGAIRDMLAGDIPLVLRKEIYATASIFGATVYILMRHLELGAQLAAWTGLFATLLLRLAAIRWHLQLPRFLGGPE